MSKTLKLAARRAVKEIQKQMQFAAESFLNFKKEFSSFNPVLAAADVTGKDFKLKNWLTLD